MGSVVPKKGYTKRHVPKMLDAEIETSVKARIGAEQEFATASGSNSISGSGSESGPASGPDLRADSAPNCSAADLSKVLSLDIAKELCPKGKEFRLVARGGGYTRMDDLSALTALDYVDVTDNALTSLDGLAGLPGLKTIIARSNMLKAIDALLDEFSNVVVLNLAENKLTSVDWLLRARFASSLSALILSGNNISNLDAVATCSSLETLVVSGNTKLDSISAVVTNCPKLRKLSAAHAAICVIPNDIALCTNLIELRISHNRIEALPDADILACLPSLKILDLGHNLITSIDSLSAVSGSLQQLNLTGNPVSALKGVEIDVEKDAEAMMTAVLQICSRVQILDGTRIAGGCRKIRNKREFKAKHDERRAREMTRMAKVSGFVAGASEWAEDVSVPATSSQKKWPRSNDGGNDKVAIGTVLSAVSTFDKPVFTKARLVRVADNDDDALEPEAFLAQAKAKSDSSVPPTKSRKSKDKSTRAKRRKQEAPAVADVDIGVGGASAWD
jgi:Leucine rich repeat